MPSQKAQPTTSSSRQRLFGPFSFNVESGELRKHGIRRKIQGQPLQILVALINHPGQLISREDFQRELWTSSTFVDFDHGLNAAMNRLRQVLDDSADQPTYIETVPGRGYRFTAEVSEDTIAPVAIMPSTTEIPEVFHNVPDNRLPRWPRRKWAAIASVMAGVFAISLAGYWAANLFHVHSNAQPLRFGILPPDGYAIEAGSSRQTFALSPDGSRLAFTAMDASGLFQTFIRDLDALESTPVANSKGSYTVFWAPDGQSLFMSLAGSLRRSSLKDDSYQMVCDLPAMTLMGASLGSHLLISGRSANFVVPMIGGTPKAVEGIYQWPQVLPDGNHLLYTVFDSKIGRYRAQVAKFGEPQTAINLLETDSRIMYAPSILNPGNGYLLFVRAGNLLAQPFDLRSLQVRGEPIAVVSKIYSFFPSGGADFSVSNNGMLAYKRYVSRSQLAWVDRRGQVVSRIGPAAVNLKQARLSPDGKKIVTAIFDVNRGVNDMWIIDVETDAARKALPGPGMADNPVWSPDSQTLVFSRIYDSPPKLFVRGLGDHDAEEPLPPDYFQVPRDWSHDGRFIFYSNTGVAQLENERKGDVWLIDMAHGRKAFPLVNTPFHEDNAALSPDGLWLAFTSTESGRAEVYLQAFEAAGTPRLVGARHPLSRDGAISLRWRRDGKELFYLAWNGMVHSIPITLTPKLKISEPVPLFSIGLEARAALHSMVGFDVSLDGLRFLVPIVTSAEKSEIVVIQNWEAEIERKRGNVN